MAQRRMISKSISTSKKLSKVSTFEALLFTWLIPHCDDYGRMDGMPHFVKGIVVPFRLESVEEIAAALKALEKIGLIKLYEVDGEQYLEIQKWEDHQTFKTDRPRIAKYPDPSGNLEIPNGNLVENSVSDLSPQVKLSEVKLSKEKIREFETFWKQYPNKKAKKIAEKAWLKIPYSKETYQTILEALAKACKSSQWTKDDGKFIPHPATWLNGERWNDEVDPVKPRDSKYNGVKSTKA